MTVPGNQHAEDLRQRCGVLQEQVAELTEELGAMKEVIGAVKKDADRYAFIRRHATLDTPHFFWSCHSPGSEVDAAIDAARGAQGESNEPI